MMKIRESALDIVAKGFYVLPLCCGQLRKKKNKETGEVELVQDFKSPACTHGAKDGTTDEGQIRVWFSDGIDKKNIGISCQNILAIDVDMKNGDGLAELAELETELGKLPAGPVSQTPSGGRHYLFKRPGVAIKGRTKIENNGKTLQIDLRVGNEYIVAPPSIGANGTPYTWLAPLTDWNDLPELPQAWIDFLPKKNETNAAPVARLSGVAENLTERERAWNAYIKKRALNYVRGCPSSVEGYGGSDDFFRAAGYLFWKFKLPESDARELLDIYNTEMCIPPWDGDEYEHKIRDALEKQPDKAAQWAAEYERDREVFCEKWELDNGIWGQTANKLVRRAREKVGYTDTPAEQSVEKKKANAPKSVLVYFDDILKEFHEASPKIPTGFHCLDTQLGGGLSEGLTIVGACPSIGKTALALQIADHAAALGFRVLFFSLEMARRELVARSLSRLSGCLAVEGDGVIYDPQAGLSADDLTDCREKIITECLATEDILYLNEHPEIAETESWVKSNDLYKEFIAPRLFIDEAGDGGEQVGTEYIRKRTESFVTEYGAAPDLVFVDYLQLLDESDGQRNLSEKQNADKAVRNLKVISREYKLPMFAISSFNRDGYTAEVSYQSFKESGGIEYGADTIIGLQLSDVERLTGDNRPAQQNRNAVALQTNEKMAVDERQIEAVILKQRNGRSRGSVKFSMFAPCGLFVDTGVENGGEYIRELRESKSSPPWQSIAHQIAEVVRDAPGYALPIEALMNDARLSVFGFDTILKAVDKSKDLKQFRNEDKDGEAWVELAIRKPKRVEVDNDKPDVDNPLI